MFLVSLYLIKISDRSHNIKQTFLLITHKTNPQSQSPSPEYIHNISIRPLFNFPDIITIINTKAVVQLQVKHWKHMSQISVII